MKKFFIIFGVIIVIIIVVGFFISKNKKSNIGMKQKVRVHIVEKGDITVKLEETGEIKPIKEIEIKSKVSGKITKYFVEEGQFINTGDVIAEIEPDYNQAETISNIKQNLELAQIRLENAQQDYDKQEKLFANNFISEAILDDAKDELKRAELGLNSALMQYELIKEIETEDNVSKIVSTASGTIIQKPVEEGEMVVSNTGSYSAGTVILKLADLERMIVETNINEVDISKIHHGQNVNIHVDAYPYKTYTGKITKIAAMATVYNNVKVFPIEIEIDEVDQELKPGMTANVTIIGEKRKDILVVPIRCIFSDDQGGDIIYQVTNDTIANSVNVQTGINDFQQVEIIRGISEGDSISYSEPVKTKQNQMKARFSK